MASRTPRALFLVLATVALVSPALLWWRAQPETAPQPGTAPPIAFEPAAAARTELVTANTPAPDIAVDPTTVVALQAKVVETRPFDRRNFTQGIEIHQGQLYVSAGYYGESALRVYDWASGKLLRERTLPPQVFAEGLTRLGDRIFQLTWQNHVLFRYDAATLAPQASLELATEGWGLTHDADRLWYSDGSALLRRLHPGTGDLEGAVDVTLRGAPVDQLNELEWVQGRIWANLWQHDRLVRIDPRDGRIEATLDLPELLPLADRRADTDVLNGIAIDPATGALWVTGKRWPTLFRLEPRVVAANAAAAVAGDE